MIRPRDFALDTFEAALAMLCGAYEGAGLSRLEIRDALARRHSAFGGAPAAQPFDASRPADGAEVYVDVKGGDHAG